MSLPTSNCTSLISVLIFCMYLTDSLVCCFIGKLTLGKFTLGMFPLGVFIS